MEWPPFAGCPLCASQPSRWRSTGVDLRTMKPLLFLKPSCYFCDRPQPPHFGDKELKAQWLYKAAPGYRASKWWVWGFDVGFTDTKPMACCLSPKDGVSINPIHLLSVCLFWPPKCVFICSSPWSSLVLWNDQALLLGLLLHLQRTPHLCICYCSMLSSKSDCFMSSCISFINAVAVLAKGYIDPGCAGIKFHASPKRDLPNVFREWLLFLLPQIWGVRWSLLTPGRKRTFADLLVLEKSSAGFKEQKLLTSKTFLPSSSRGLGFPLQSFQIYESATLGFSNTEAQKSLERGPKNFQELLTWKMGIPDDPSWTLAEGISDELN